MYTIMPICFEHNSEAPMYLITSRDENFGDYSRDFMLGVFNSEIKY
ncbi:hypothetical protein [Terrisporobacter sp.]